MSIRSWALLPLAMSLAAGVCAQTAAPAKADPKADPAAAEAAAAMERAKRQAAGPMRIILEASKSRRKAGEAEPPVAPAAVTAPVADGTSVRTIATRSVAAPAPEPAAAPVPVPAPAPPPPVASTISTQITLSSEALQSRSVSSVPGLETSGAAAGNTLAVPSAALPKLAEGPIKPKLVNRVDPVIPQRALDDLGRNAGVLVDIDIRADGSVSSAAVLGAVPARVRSAVVAAVEQWRFEPLPSARVYRVELFFNAE